MARDISATIKINDGFSNPLANFASKLASSTNKLGQLGQKMAGIGRIKPPTPDFDRFNSSLERTNGLFGKMVGANVAGNMISKGIGMATNSVSSLIGELNESSAAWQTFNGNLSMIGMSSGQIKSVQADLQQFAQQTIYSSSDMAQTYAQFASVGVKNADQLVKGFGGIAAAATDPQQAMKTLSQQSVQAAAKPTIQWQDFNLMLQQTPAGMAQVAKTMGMSMKDMITQVHAGKVKTQDFFNAISKTGTNKAFSKMATQYKTIGQAADGLKETLGAKLQKVFDNTSKVGINAISKLTDAIGNINFNALAAKIVPVAQTIMDKVTTVAKFIGGAFSNVWSGLSNSGAISSVSNAIGSISGAIGNMFRSLNGGGKNPFGIFKTIGSIAGAGISTAANAISALADAVGKIDPRILKAVGVGILGIYGSSKLLNGGALSGLASMPDKIFSLAGALEGLAGIPSKLAQLPSFIGSIVSAAQLFAGAGVEVAIAWWPITAVILAVSAIVLAAIWAWNDNFLGFRDIVSNIFNDLGSIFAPFTDALSTVWDALKQLGQALQPVADVLIPAFKAAIGSIAIGVIFAIALAIGVVADALIIIISIGGAVVHAIGSVVNGFLALNDAMNLDFSAAGKHLSAAKADIDGVGDSLSRLGQQSVTGKLIGQFSQLGSKATETQSTVNGMNLTPHVNTTNAMNQLNNLGSQQIPAPKIGTPQLPGGNIFATLQNQAQNTTIPAPKVSQPELVGGGNIASQLTAQMPKTVAGPKVEQSTIPAPKMPATTQTTIPAPKVETPNMNASVNAIQSGIQRMIAAARSAAAPFADAIHNMVNQGVSAARSGHSAMQSAGSFIGQGLASGIRSQIGAVSAAADALVSQANRATRAKAQIHSPSRMFMELGGFVGQGFANGITNTGPLVQNVSANMAGMAINTTADNVPTNGGLTPSQTSNVYNNNNTTTQGGSSTNNTIHNDFHFNIAASDNPEITAERVLDLVDEGLRKKQAGGQGYGYA